MRKPDTVTHLLRKFVQLTGHVVFGGRGRGRRSRVHLLIFTAALCRLAHGAECVLHTLGGRFDLLLGGLGPLHLGALGRVVVQGLEHERGKAAISAVLGVVHL